MGQFSAEKPVAPGSVLSGNQQCDVSAEISDYFALLRVVGKSVLDGQRAIFDTQRHAMSRSSEFERDILTLCRRNCRNALNESGYPAEG
jgi:hypothetical protein